MNYANMIKEERLKQGFIIATLLSTIMGTFTTGINLIDKVGEKRKQMKRDKGQDEKITNLQKQITDLEKRPRKDEGNDRDERELKKSMQRSGPMIRREYDYDYERLGPQFARGDVVTQNQLQSQVIMLQGTVINLLEEALQTGRIANVNKLYNASEFARDGTIAALHSQYQRMLQAAPLSRSGRPLPMRRISSTPSLQSQRGTRKAPSVRGRNGCVSEVVDVPDEPQDKALVVGNAINPSGPLFCRYAAALQGGESLDVCFSKGGSNSCPLCGTNIAVESGRAWKITKEVVHERISMPDYDDEVIEDRTYLVNNRFVIKCHREGSGYACVLCYRHREKDTLLESANGLIRHVWQRHTVEELGADLDVREVAATKNTISQRRDA